MEERLQMMTIDQRQGARYGKTAHFKRFSLILLLGLLGACASTVAPQQSIPSERNVLPRELGETVSIVAPKPTRAPVFGAKEQALLEDSLRPGFKLDLTEVKAKADLWARLRAGFSMPELENDWVRKAEGWYGSRPDYVQRMTERGSLYLFHIVEEVEKRGMPTEMALLPFIESAFNPQALSTAKASGMWQFVPATGRDFDLKQNIFRDDRRDVLASTRAALDYLARLHEKFGDWHLALAAYNWGQGNVQKAIDRNQRAGLPTDYESLKMPDETRYYVPKLQAIKNIIQSPQKFAVSLPDLANHPYFLSVNIDRDMDVDVAARLAGVTPELFKQFNPQMNKPVILAASTTQVLLPYDNASAFASNLAAHQGQLASWTAWVVPKTMKAAEAAKMVGMGDVALRDINKIPPRMLVKQGSTLLVSRSANRQEDVSSHLADYASMSLSPEVPPTPTLQRINHKAGAAETVATVAARYHVKPALIAQWNKVGPKASFKPGTMVQVYVAGDAAKRVAKAPAKTAKPGRSATAAQEVKTAAAPKLAARQLAER